MKQLFFLLTALIFSLFELTAQETKKQDLVGYGDGRFEVFKTGDHHWLI